MCCCEARGSLPACRCTRPRSSLCAGSIRRWVRRRLRLGARGRATACARSLLRLLLHPSICSRWQRSCPWHRQFARASVCGGDSTSTRTRTSASFHTAHTPTFTSVGTFFFSRFIPRVAAASAVAASAAATCACSMDVAVDSSRQQELAPSTLYSLPQQPLLLAAVTSCRCRRRRYLCASLVFFLSRSSCFC